jgi:hypothetical protein
MLAGGPPETREAPPDAAGPPTKIRSGYHSWGLGRDGKLGAAFSSSWHSSSQARGRNHLFSDL